MNREIKASLFYNAICVPYNENFRLLLQYGDALAVIRNGEVISLLIDRLLPNVFNMWFHINDIHNQNYNNKLIVFLDPQYDWKLLFPRLFLEYHSTHIINYQDETITICYYR